jgi:hypothetical protein
MPSWKDGVFEKWWPLGQSFAFVHTGLENAAKAIQTDCERLRKHVGWGYRYNWIQISSFDELFSSVDEFKISASLHFAIATRSGWTVLWDNNHACTPDSFAYGLTRFQALETLSFSSTDRNSTQLAGTHFTHRRLIRPDEMVERDVYCCNQSKRWHFEQHGTPLPEEDLHRYEAKQKRDRLNEEGMMAILERIGIHPWRESTYDFSQKCFCSTSQLKSPTNKSFTFLQIQRKAGGTPPPEEDEELVGPPSYLQGRVKEAKADGPALRLIDGKWCGHGEEIFWLYDIEFGDCHNFSVRLPEPRGLPVVVATSTETNETFPLYDARHHPASGFSSKKTEPMLCASVQCPRCYSTIFQIAVGFEVPADAESPNDTSWFALSLKCAKCGYCEIAYDDETA